MLLTFEYFWFQSWAETIKQKWVTGLLFRSSNKTTGPKDIQVLVRKLWNSLLFSNTPWADPLGIGLLLEGIFVGPYDSRMWKSKTKPQPPIVRKSVATEGPGKKTSQPNTSRETKKRASNDVFCHVSFISSAWRRCFGMLQELIKPVFLEAVVHLNFKVPLNGGCWRKFQKTQRHTHPHLHRFTPNQISQKSNSKWVLRKHWYK